MLVSLLEPLAQLWPEHEITDSEDIIAILASVSFNCHIEIYDILWNRLPLRALHIIHVSEPSTLPSNVRGKMSELAQHACYRHDKSEYQWRFLPLIFTNFCGSKIANSHKIQTESCRSFLHRLTVGCLLSTLGQADSTTEPVPPVYSRYTFEHDFVSPLISRGMLRPFSSSRKCTKYSSTISRNLLTWLQRLGDELWDHCVLYAYLSCALSTLA